MHQDTEQAVSRADAPDLDWSQVTETVRMLNLAVAQIAMAMEQGEDSVESLTLSFTMMVNNVNLISEAAANYEPGGDVVHMKSEILSHCVEVQGGIQQSIVAFQFYDRLSQRLDHVKDALEKLSRLVADRSRLFNPAEWEMLQGDIRRRYTMKEEQEMFEALLHGATVEQALEQVKDRLHRGDIDDIEDIELF